jgi:hypothetical protein
MMHGMTVRLTEAQKTFLRSLATGPQHATAKTRRTAEILLAQELIRETKLGGFPAYELTEGGKAYTHGA